jgi:hypothetical protein
MSWRVLRLLGACSVLVAIGASACGGSSSDSHPSSGNAGAGGSDPRAAAGSGGRSTIGRAGASGAAGTPVAPVPVTCGKASCAGVVLPVLNLPVQGCCADERTNHCGLDSSVLEMFGPTFSEPCQPLAQPGKVDTACPDSPAAPVTGTGLSVSFRGCCRADHVCGYQLDTVGGILQLGLGCVDSAPFLDGGAPQACGDTGAAGAGGEGNSAGAGGDSSGMAGAAGEAASGGAAD